MRKIALLFLACALVSTAAWAQCQHSVALIDSYGDGWNGGLLTVSVNGTPVLTAITLASGTGPQIFTFTAAAGDTIFADYTPGSWAYENEYIIYNGGGGVLVHSGAGGVEPVDNTVTGACPATQTLTQMSPVGTGAVIPAVGTHTVVQGGVVTLAALPSDTWYAFDIYPGDDSVRFDPTSPSTFNIIAPNIDAQFISGGTWANGVWYVVSYAAAPAFSNFYSVNPATGAMTLIGVTGTQLNGIAYNEVAGIMYGTNYTAATTSDLYTINIATGATTLVGSSAPNILFIDIAYGNGVLYGADLISDNLYTINVATGAGTVVGPLGFGLNYAQGMEYDKDNNRLFMTAYTTTGVLLEINTSTGAAWSWGTLSTGAETDGFAIPYGITHVWEFDRWERNGTSYSTDPVTTITMSNDYSVQAFFTTGATTYTLNMLAPGGTGTGTVVPAVGSHIYAEGTYANLSATPDAGCYFVQWLVDGTPVSTTPTYSVLMNGNHSAQAIIDLCDVTCPSGGIPESEACGDDTNGGCNMTTPAFEPISAGQTICGTIWNDGATRDTDWFMITATDWTEFTMTASAELPFAMGYIEYLACLEGSGSCTDISGNLNPFATAGLCGVESIVVNVPAGSHMFFIAPSLFTGSPCGSANDYYVTITAAPGTPPTTYCTVTSTVEDEYISNVTFGTINNTTGYDGYGDYTAQSAAITVGTPYTMTITLGTSYSTDQGAVYIDWNGDFDFCDLDEAYTTLTGSPGIGPYTISITPPVHAVNGAKRLRVGMNYSAVAPSCGSTTYGDYEDYTVVISGGVAPTATPTSGPTATPGPVPVTGPAGIGLMLLAIGALMSLAGLRRK